MAKRSFEAWMAKVDSYCWALVGCSASDMSDMGYRNWFEEGMSPKQAARKAIRCESGEDW
jgi:hypothetical protein